MRVAMRSAEVGGVPVDALPAAFRLRTSEAAAVSEVVVHPEERRIVRNLQARIVQGQNLLVGTEHGRTIRAKHRLLRGEYVLHQFNAPFHVLRTIHPLVVDAADPDRPEAVVVTVVVHTPLPVVVDARLVFGIVPDAQLLLVPVAVVPQHRLAVARADGDARLARSVHVLLAGDELVCAWVHCGPQKVHAARLHVGEYLTIRLSAYPALLAEARVAPRPQAPVLVVDENAAVSDSRAVTGRSTVYCHPEVDGFLVVLALQYLLSVAVCGAELELVVPRRKPDDGRCVLLRQEFNDIDVALAEQRTLSVRKCKIRLTTEANGVRELRPSAQHIFALAFV